MGVTGARNGPDRHVVLDHSAVHHVAGLAEPTVAELIGEVVAVIGDFFYYFVYPRPRHAPQGYVGFHSGVDQRFTAEEDAEVAGGGSPAHVVRRRGGKPQNT